MEIFRLAGLDAPKQAMNDRSELAEFLKGAGGNIEQMNILLPPEYLNAMKKYSIDCEFNQEVKNLPVSEENAISIDEDRDPG